MRIAPVGLYLGKHLHARGDTYDINSREWIIENAAEIAAITHGQDLGYIPAAAQALIIDAIIYGSYSGENDLYEIISGSVRNVCRVFKDSLHISEFEQLMAKAISLATGKTGDLTCISELGQGWTGDEALAIAIFCALRYKRDFEKAITTSVNHDGDSDSTGSLTGNILGAYHGFNALPQHFIEDLELKDIILEIADDLYCDCEPKNRWFSYEAFVDTAWSHKYHLRDYPNVI
jgi:ADP-ribosylglycohydrolase